jgi:PAS domain S-box-containing protein
VLHETTTMNTAHFFEPYYNNAEVNSILIMNPGGEVLDVNKSFTAHFGYSNADIRGKNFSLLFTDSDKKRGKPQLELEIVAKRGQAHDESYIMNKEGEAVWCTGESLLVVGEEGENYIVKDVVNLQSRKQVQLFLNDTEELLERIFLSSKDVAMMILDGSLKIQKVNSAFLQLFDLKEAPAMESRLADLPHCFWKGEGIRNELRQTLVSNSPLKDREFLLETAAGDKKKLNVSSKIVDRRSGSSKHLFVIIDEV